MKYYEHLVDAGVEAIFGGLYLLCLGFAYVICSPMALLGWIALRLGLKVSDEH